MRAYLPEYDLRAPKTLDEALRLLANEPGVWRALAGGTDLMVLLESGALQHKNFLSIWHLPELKGIEATPEHVTLILRSPAPAPASEPARPRRIGGGARDGRSRHTESRDARRQHRQRFTRRRHAARAPRL